VQLYTVRESLAEDLPETLQRIADIGFTQVEPFAFLSFPSLARGLEAAGLVAPTAHQRFIGGDLPTIFASARSLGVGTVIDPHVPDERWLSRESVEQVARDFNAALKVASDYDVTVGYHNHFHELESTIDGVSALEIFAAALDERVALEVDTYWVAAAGLDPIALLSRLRGRVKALHIKDGPASKDPLDQVAVGHGSLPIREIIAAAPDALRVIELDDSAGDRFQAVADSFAYLTEAGLE
jgi:sugar phosphate isomerase/epimerase